MEKKTLQSGANFCNVSCSRAKIFPVNSFVNPNKQIFNLRMGIYDVAGVGKLQKMTNTCGLMARQGGWFL